MAEYIEQEAANQLKAEIQKLNEMLFWINGNESCKLKISDITEIRDSMLNAYYALQEQEVRHGKWIKSKNQRECSLCGYFYFTNTKSFNYCPHCGAKMDRGDDNA